jgi:hypothetical protein
MSSEDIDAFNLKMSELRTGTMSHHKVLQGNGSKLILDKIGKHNDFKIEEVGCGLGGKWRVFFYRTGYAPANTLEAERYKAALAKGEGAEYGLGTLWCALIGHLEGNAIELFVGGSKAESPGDTVVQKTIAERDAIVKNPIKYKQAVAAARAENELVGTF